MTPIHYRPARREDEPVLRDMLYQAIFVPVGEAPPPRDLVFRPELARYVQGWGQPGDLGVIAFDSETGIPTGAAWLRLFSDQAPGYGYVDERTPELSIAVVPEQRSRGIGSELLARLLAAAQGQYTAISLSVSTANPAYRLYRRFGFEQVAKSGESLTMVKKLRAQS